MRVLVIGLGSMGKRRIRLIKSIDESITVIGVDTSEERRSAAAAEFGISCADSLSAAIDSGAECAFVSTSPLSHAAVIAECLNGGLHVFTEINLVPEMYEENMQTAAEKGLVLFLSSTFLYRRETKHIISRVSQSKAPLNYVYHIGQYLPDWHPWEDYRSYFIGDKRSNGCREILAIELPWLISCFGDAQITGVQKSKNTTLNIGYDDNYLISLCHDSGAKGLLAVDVVSRKAVRRFEVFGEDMYITWNGTPDSVSEYDFVKKLDVSAKLFDASEHREGYASFIIEDPYKDEILSFFEKIKNPDAACAWDFERDAEMLKLIDIIGA